MFVASNIDLRFSPTMQECATDKAYCLAMQSEGLIEDLVNNLQTTSPQLKMLCASAIFRLAEEQESRHLVKYIIVKSLRKMFRMQRFAYVFKTTWWLGTFG